MSAHRDALAREVNTALDSLLPEGGETSRLYEAMRYSLTGGGKRLRALMLLEFCELFGGDRELAMKFACAIECIHAYSLIHDDLPCMDDDDMRRGKPSCHIAFGENVAVLAGDALQTFAFEQMALAAAEHPAEGLEALRVAACAAGPAGMCGGQLLDLENETRRASRARLETTCALKTGALISAACEIGAILGGADSDGRKAACRYAEGVGLAFQVMDDLLDVVGSAESFGKATGADERRGKSTFASELGTEECERLIRSLTDGAVAAIKDIPGSEELVALAEELARRSF